MARTSTAIRPTVSLPHSGNVAVFSLNNGIRIFCYENFSSPAVVVSGFLRTGAVDERRNLAGLAGFTTDCRMRGTSGHSYTDIFERTESVGASMSVSSGVFNTGFFAKSLAEDLPMMLDLLAEVLREPTFPDAELERERDEWLTSLQERSNSTRSMASLAFYEAAYPEIHPFHYSSDGYPETAQRVAGNVMGAMAFMHHAPDVADQRVIVGCDVGKAGEETGGHCQSGWHLAPAPSRQRTAYEAFMNGITGASRSGRTGLAMSSRTARGSPNR